MVNQAFFHENGERAQNFCFVFGVHGQIRIFPVTKDAQPLKLFALDVDELLRERLGLFADLQRRKSARFLDDLIFDWESVTIPARNVWRAFPQHRLRFDHEIFEDFVQRCPHVDIAIRERRTIMQNE